MGYEIVRGPFLLMETVAMLHKYVNGISFQSAISRQRFFMSDPAYQAQSKRMARLQRIMEEVCTGVDVRDGRIRHYFASAGEDPETCDPAAVLPCPVIGDGDAVVIGGFIVGGGSLRGELAVGDGGVGMKIDFPAVFAEQIRIHVVPLSFL